MGDAPPPGEGTVGDGPRNWHGVDDVTEERSELHVYARRNGTARWVVRVDLSGSGVDALRSKDDLTGWVRDHVPLGGTDAPIRDPSARFEGQTLVVAYTTDDASSRGVGGVVLFDELFEMDDLDGLPAYRLGADRVVVHAPEGMVVTNRPPGTKRVGPSAVAWSGDDEDSVLAHTYVTFGPDGDAETWAASQVTVGRAVAAWAAEPLVVAAALPQLLVFLLVGLVVLAADESPVSLTTPSDEEWNDGVEVAGRNLPSMTVDGDAIRLPWELGLGLGASAFLGIAFAGSFGLRVLGWVAFSLPVVPLATILVLGPVADLSPRLRRVLVGFLLGTPVVAAVPPVLSFGGGGLLLAPVWALGIVVVGGPLMGLGWIGTKALFDDE